MGQSSSRDESSNSHRLPAFTNSPYDEDTEEIWEEDSDTEEIWEEDSDTEEIEEEDIELIAGLLKRASLFKDEDTEEIEEEEKDTDPHRVERSELVEGDHIYKWSASIAYAHHASQLQNYMQFFTEEIEEEDEDTDPHRVERSKLVEGDHIYKWSASTAYAHHGIYIGKDLVIHFLYVTADSSSSATLSTPGFSGLFSKISKSTSSGPNSSGVSSHVSVSSGRYFKNNFSSDGNELLTCLDTLKCNRQFGTGVVLNCLNCFLKRKKYYLCRYEYGVSRSTFEGEDRGGTCTTAESGSPKEVINRARYLLQEGFGSYHLEKNNCEDFALYCKTGLLVCNKSAPPTCGQINYALSLSSKERYSRDIGVRNDVMKVEVENVEEVLNRRVGQ